MVRNPLTVSLDDTVVATLIKGKQMMISSFPVMDGDNVVGTVSDREIFITLFKLLEAGAERTRITLTGVPSKKGPSRKYWESWIRPVQKARSIFTVPEEKKRP